MYLIASILYYDDSLITSVVRFLTKLCQFATCLWSALGRHVSWTHVVLLPILLLEIHFFTILLPTSYFSSSWHVAGRLKSSILLEIHFSRYYFPLPTSHLVDTWQDLVLLLHLTWMHGDLLQASNCTPECARLKKDARENENSNKRDWTRFCVDETFFQTCTRHS